MNGWFNEKSDFVYIDTCSREEIKEHQNEREREREREGGTMNDPSSAFQKQVITVR